VVSDYLTPYDGEQQYLAAQNRPVATFTYRMSFSRAANGNGGHDGSVLTTS